jgi:hypothetical protein
LSLVARLSITVALGEPQTGENAVVAVITVARKPVVECGDRAFDVTERTHHWPPCAGDLASGASIIDNLLGLLDSHVVEKLPVRCHDWRMSTGRLTLDPFQSDGPVVSGLAVTDTAVLD